MIPGYKFIIYYLPWSKWLLSFGNQTDCDTNEQLWPYLRQCLTLTLHEIKDSLVVVDFLNAMLLRLTTDELSGDRWTAPEAWRGAERCCRGDIAPFLLAAGLCDCEIGLGSWLWWAGRGWVFGLWGRTLSDNAINLRTASGESDPVEGRNITNLFWS